MTKVFKTFFSIWLILFVVLNVCAFAIPKTANVNFFVIYCTVVTSFIIELITAYFSFNQKELKNKFYNLPAFCVSSVGLILIIIISLCGFLIKDFPVWVIIVTCAIILGIILVIVIGAKFVADNAKNYDEKIGKECL